MVCFHVHLVVTEPNCVSVPGVLTDPRLPAERTSLADASTGTLHV